MAEEIELIAVCEGVAPDAPAAQKPRSTRARLLNPPDHRYQTAITYLQDENRGVTPVIPSDIITQYTIRALRGYDNPHSRTMVLNKWPAMETALYYGTLGSHTAMAAELNTYLIKGFDYDKAFMSGCVLSKEEYKLYEAIFFDLSGIRAVHSWINDFLFEPERHHDDARLLRSRMLAYYGGSTDGVYSFTTGWATASETALMKQLIANERQRTLFDYLMKVTNLSPEVYAGLMESAMKNMSDRDFQEKALQRAETGSGSLEELAMHMEEGIRAYSLKESKASDPSGVDFTNQYLPAIIKGDVNGKDNIKE